MYFNTLSRVLNFFDRSSSCTIFGQGQSQRFNMSWKVYRSTGPHSKFSGKLPDCLQYEYRFFWILFWSSKQPCLVLWSSSFHILTNYFIILRHLTMLDIILFIQIIWILYNWAGNLTFYLKNSRISSILTNNFQDFSANFSCLLPRGLSRFFLAISAAMIFLKLSRL